ncbi:MAG: EamA family transporter [Clostridiales bacterium]|nr:EamA family transporter [Clostridiales bacterium]
MNVKQKSFFSGVAAVTASAVLFGFLPIWCKQVLLSGVDSGTLVLLRYGFATVMLAILLPIFGISFSITKKQFAAFAAFGLFSGGVTSWFLSQSYLYMFAGIATMFHFSYPIFVAVLMSVIYKEKLSRKTVAAIIAAVLGMALMADIKGDFSPVGTIFALISGLTLAIYIIAAKKSAFSVLHPMKIVFYSSLVSTIFLAATQLAGRNINLPSNTSDWVRIVVISLLCTVASHSLLAYGIQKLGATTGAIISMSEPLVSVAAGAVIINEIPSARVQAGCALVLAALVVLILSNSKKEKAGKEELKKEEISK